MLQECRRVVKLGGRIRVATPDLEAVISLKDASPGSIKAQYIEWIIDSYVSEAEGYLACYAINQLFRGWEHNFIYDEQTLQAVLERTGFTDVRRSTLGHSSDETLAGIEGHGREDGNQRMSEFETMILEATAS